jgi:DNA replication protein DnaC
MNTELPLTTESANCEKHGPYLSQLMPSPGCGGAMKSRCPECASEREAIAVRASLEYEEKERQRRIQQLRTKAGIPPRYSSATFDSFFADSDKQKHLRDGFRKYGEMFTELGPQGAGILCVGTKGTGKTLLCCALANALTEAEIGVIYRNTGDVVRTLREARRFDSDKLESAVLLDLSKVNLLILDEVEDRADMKDHHHILSELINMRYERIRPTIVVSNLDRKQLTVVLGERAVDRLCQPPSRVLAIDGASYRDKPQKGAIAKPESTSKWVVVGRG